MKIKLVTLFDDKFKVIGEPSSRVMAQYCATRGYEFVCYNHLPDKSRNAQWNKTRIVQQELPDCDWLVWMDADSIPVNHNFQMEQMVRQLPDKDLIISGDDNGLCFGVFAVRNCAWSMQFFQTLWFVGQMKLEKARQYHPSPQFDQPSVIALMENFPAISSRIAVLGQDWVANPRSAFSLDSFAAHYWSSDTQNDSHRSIARKIESFIAHGWTPACHKSISIVTASDAKMKDILNLSMAQNAERDYTVRLYDINGELGFGCKFDCEMPKCEDGGIVAERLCGRLPVKPAIIKQAMKDYGGFLAWMDADAFAVRRFDEVYSQDYDVGVTMRRREERNGTSWPILYGFLNAGVIFFNETEAARRFVDLWEAEMANSKSNSDQEALNMLVLQATDLTEYNKVFTLHGIRIKVFHCDDYNFYYFPQEPLSTTKIVHAKTDRRAAMADWGNRDWNKEQNGNK